MEALTLREEYAVEQSTSGNINAVVDESAVENPSERASNMIYKIEFTDKAIGFKQTFESKVSFGPLERATENIDHQKPIRNALEDKAPIEVITQIWGRAIPEMVDRLAQKDPMAKRIAFQDIKIGEVGKARMRIRQPLLKIIRKCVTYYPGQPLTGEMVELNEPYPVLIHHLDKLEEMQRQLEPEDDMCKCLRSMLEYLKEYIKPRISFVMEKLKQPMPSIAFDELWLLFKPGTEVYLHPYPNSFRKIFVAGVVVNTTLEKAVGQKDKLLVYYWCMETDGKTFGRAIRLHNMWDYKGERQVTSLSIYPCRYHDSKDGGKTRKELVDRGQKAYHILRGMPKHMCYDGYVLSWTNRIYQGYCVLDTIIYLSRSDVEKLDENRKPLTGFLNAELTFQQTNSDMFGQTLPDFIYSSFHHIDLAETHSLPTDRHYFFTSAFIPGFALYDKTWRIFSVDSLREAQPTMEMDNLIIDPINRDIVQAITYEQSNPYIFDQAHNKGEGRVILLHGSPGVGKTYTVECIAQSTGRPLISLTLGDLMDEGDKVNETLTKWFTLSEHWKAILLLDEADVFLERRATRDIQRNGIVSVFLRRMEYFRGLLFLTTNRVGQIDDAFLSRVSVVLQYEYLSDDTRKKIWQGFFKKLDQDTKIPGGKKIEVDKYAQKYVFNDDDVRDLQWNGREIRNALQTAISLANYKAVQDGKKPEEPIEVEIEHFRSVVSMSQKFKKYMRDISGLEEDARAQARQDRRERG